MKVLFRWSLTTVTLLAFLLPIARAQDSLNIRLEDQFLSGWFDAREVVQNGGTAYVAAGQSGIFVFDINDLYNITELDPINNNEPITAIAVSGVYLYALGRAGTLYVYDVTDPSNVTLAASLSTSLQGKGKLEKGGQFLFATGGTDLEVIDVNDPLNPTERGTLALGIQTDVGGLTVQGNIAYLYQSFATSSFWVVDASDTQNPTMADTISVGASVLSIDSAPGRLFVGTQSALYTYNISTPLAPSQEYVNEQVYSIASVKALSATSVLVDAAYTYSVTLFDYSSPMNPTLTGSIQLFGRSGYLTATNGGSALLLSPYSDMIAIDMVDPSSPARADSVGRYTRIATLSSEGTHLFTENHGAFQTFDISQLSPTLSSSIAVPGVLSIVVENNTAYLGDYSGNLTIYNVSDASSPNRISQTTLHTDAEDMVKKGNYLYIANYDLPNYSNLTVVDVSDLTDPQIVGTSGYFHYHDDAQGRMSLTVSDTLAFVITSSDLEIVDISDPTNPVLQDPLIPGGMPEGVAVIDHYLLMSVGYSPNLQIYDLSPGPWPQYVNSIDDPSLQGRLKVKGDLLFVAGDTSGFRVRKWNGPNDLPEIGYYDGPGVADRFTLAGNRAYVSYTDRIKQFNLEDVYGLDFPGDVAGVGITARAGTGSIADLMVDRTAIAALDSAATDGYDDSLDVPKPASPPDGYVSVVFPHPDWGVTGADNFMIDTRNANDDLTTQTKVFAFDVNTDQISRMMSLDFTVGSRLPHNYSLKLVDYDNEVVQDLRLTPTYSYTAQNPSHSFALTIGPGIPVNMAFTNPSPGDSLLPSGATVDVGYTSNSNLPLQWVRLRYSLDDGQTWTLVDSVTGDPGSISFDVPDTISYFTKLELTGLGSLGLVSTERLDIAIAGTSASREFTGNWGMFSPPVMDNTASVGDQLGDDLTGAYSIYRYQSGTGYVLADTLRALSGYWYWLNSADQTVILDGTPITSGVSMPTPSGWNLIGSGLQISVPKDSLRFTDGQDIDTYQDALARGWLSGAMYSYGGEINGYANTDTLEPFTGYWLNVMEPGITLISRPCETSVTTLVASETGRSRSPKLGSELDDADNWFIGVHLRENGRRETLAGFGVSADATPGFDARYDLPVPPALPDGHTLRAYFHRPQWHSPAGSDFSQVRSAPLRTGASRSWTFRIDDDGDAPLALVFTGLEDSVPSEYTVTAQIGTQRYNLRHQSQIVLGVNALRTVSVTVADAASSAAENGKSLPKRYAISSVYPNPFNPEVNVTVAVPRRSRIRGEIVNVLGQTVKRLDLGHVQPGYHRFSWRPNGTSGVYFLHLKADNGWQATRKLLFVK